MAYTLIRHRGSLALAVTLVITSIAQGEDRSLRDALAPPQYSPSIRTAPTIGSIEGGLRVTNFRLSATSIHAFPLLSPPASGFTPLVVATLTDQQGDDDFSSVAIKQTFVTGDPLNKVGTSNRYMYLATLDSGGQSHILSRADSSEVNLEDVGRQGGFDVEVVGAGTEREYLDVSDPLGFFVTGVNQLTSAPASALQAPTSSFKGQIHTSVLTISDSSPDSRLPSIVGGPMFANYAVNIRNSDTRRIIKPDGTAVRTPSIDFVEHGAGTQHQFKITLALQDQLGASATDPSFIPSFENFNDFSDNPTAPTFWTFPFAKVQFQPGPLAPRQDFLFDTGAQVTVLSEDIADAIGFDVGVVPPDFEVDIQGVGEPVTAKGYFIPYLEIPVTGGDAIFNDVPIIVLNITDPRNTANVLPGIIGMNLFTDRDLTVDMNNAGAGLAYARFSAPITPEWKVNASGAWLPDANWALGVPDGVDVPANFLGAITSAKTIAVDGDYIIGSMKFDNLNSYTLTGAGRLTFATLGRPSKIEVVKGNHTVASPMSFANLEVDSVRMNLIVAAGSTLTLSGDTTSPDAVVTKSGAGQVRLKNAHYAGLAVTQGSVQLLASASTTDGNLVKSLAISNGATLDLTNRPMAIDYDTASPIATVRGDLLAGRLLSSLATANRAIGYGEASVLGLTSFGGLGLTGDAVVMRLTLNGDADLNLTVGFPDLVALAQHYNQTSQPWTSGDFDYDGTVGFNDLVALAQNYNGTYALDELPGGGDFAADWALAQAFVPEPSALMAIAALGLLGRRRSR